MDYCSTCCRHLNGALVCPGCGAYAPDIAPLADGTPAPATATGAAARQAPVHLWNETDSGAEECDQTPQEHPYDSADAPAPAPQGRAARRRQRERWKKTQRKALVATAVALVGGGMTVSSLNRQAPDRTQAASAPDREPMGIAEEQVTEPTPVSSTPTDPHRAKHTSSATRSSTADVPREQAAAPRATPATQVIQQKSVRVPLTAVKASPASQAASTMSDATDTAPETTATPTPPAADGTGTSTSDTDTSAATPSPSESSPTPPSTSSPSELCVLGLVCIS
ncbi:hypothetical protein GCM10023084_68770 [Streptomyces lacrimifluminis]|uniref:Uncharacterized protein n=1 Tax=Streptomyces lacrimifluminis TaxID=1500077 RepID=A0A917NZB0_9ACTN|nr:hypothetical protein [Streptomyces lacrimifluminis]GGJ43360.1 hypothetical protein GCM10012282_45370 [Streptomyces lacrimifluminis]